MFKNYKIAFAAILFLSLSATAQPWMKTSMLSLNADQEERKQNFHDIQKIFNDYWKDKSPSEDEQENASEGGYQQFKRWEWFMKPRTFPTGDFFDPEILFKEYKKQKNSQKRLSVHPAITSANWSFIGPDVVPSGGGGIGRINAIRFDPVNHNIIYAGSANGGLWKSTTGGGNWTTFTDYLPALGVADIAINPRFPDSIYIGTGDRDGYEVGVDFWGGTYSAGVLVSPDGGLTWNATGLSYIQTQSNIMHRLLINPDDPTILLAANRSGIYRTTNAGANWNLVQSGNIFDMEFKPGDANTVYGVTSTTLYISTDAGATWTSTYTGLGGGGGAVIAVTEANPLVIYSLSGNFIMKKSSDGGMTFTTLTSPSSAVNNQGFYDCALAVSPTNENVVFCAGSTAVSSGSGIAKSTDGGVSWIGVGSTHVDHHDLQFEPGSGTTIYNTNDGGIYKSTNTGSSWSNIGDGIAIKQYYRIGTSALTPYLLYGGAQDNGTDQLKNGSWSRVKGGDGMDCLIDYTNDNIAYVSSQNAAFYKTTNGGNTFSAMTLPGSGDWTTPIVMDPGNHNTLYVGLSNLYKSTDAGGSWNAISNGQFGANIISIAVAPNNVNNIYAATLSKICRTTNGGTTWTTITNGLPLSNSGITSVAISSLDPMKVWVTLTGYVASTKVYYSADGGTTWTNFSGSLPNVPADCIVYQANSQDAVYVGTDFGVYFRDTTMADWIPFNSGLPNVIVDELEIQYGSINKIRAATYGRGVWESDLNVSTVFALDAGIIDILSPGPDKLECDTSFVPSINIRNFGQVNITSLNIHFQVDANPLQVLAWSGTLTPGNNALVTLPVLAASPGAHSFTVFVSDPNGTTDQNSFNDSRTTTFNIVNGLPYIAIREGFDSAGYPPPLWSLTDQNSLMQQFSLAGGFGNSTSSLKARNYTATTAYAYLYSPQINFTNLLAPVSLTFSLANVMRSATSNDSLSILVSTDCGTSFSQVYSKTGNALATGPIHAGNFTPTAADWRTEPVDLTSFIGQTQVQIEFVFYGDHGNNTYIDDINILDGSTGISSTSNENIFYVYPNPTTGAFSLSFHDHFGEKAELKIYNMVGGKVFERHITIAPAISFNQSEIKLPKGMYVIGIATGNSSLKKKLVIE